MAIDCGQAQVIAYAIDTLVNILAKPTHESWRQTSALIDTVQRLRLLADELTREQWDYISPSTDGY